MWNQPSLTRGLIAAAVGGGLVLTATSWAVQDNAARPVNPPYDAALDAQTPRTVPVDRPEQRKTEHDLSDVFTTPNAPLSSPAL
jgi:hypothetical protein